MVAHFISVKVSIWTTEKMAAAYSLFTVTLQNSLADDVGGESEDIQPLNNPTETEDKQLNTQIADNDKKELGVCNDPLDKQSEDPNVDSDPSNNTKDEAAGVSTSQTTSSDTCDKTNNTECGIKSSELADISTVSTVKVNSEPATEVKEKVDALDDYVPAYSKPKVQFITNNNYNNNSYIILVKMLHCICQPTLHTFWQVFSCSTADRYVLYLNHLHIRFSFKQQILFCISVAARYIKTVQSKRQYMGDVDRQYYDFGKSTSRLFLASVSFSLVCFLSI